jgi:hypothetical protein
MDPVTISIALIVGKVVLKHQIRCWIQTETERTIALILTLLRDGYNIHTLHDVAKKKRAWTYDDPTEAEWRSLFAQGSCRHVDEVKELVERYQSETTRALVKAVVKDGETALKRFRVQRAAQIIPNLVEAGFDMQQLNIIFSNCNSQGMGEGEVMDAIAVLAHDDDATRALLHLALELCHLYQETGDVREVVGRVAEVGIQVLDNGWDLLQQVAEFILDATT